VPWPGRSEEKNRFNPFGDNTGLVSASAVLTLGNNVGNPKSSVVADRVVR
jgi:hypothetical protein